MEYGAPLLKYKDGGGLTMEGTASLDAKTIIKFHDKLFETSTLRDNPPMVMF